MPSTNPTHSTHGRGQVLVIVGVAMVALVAMVGLIIDGGFAWAENRAAQNGVDATAHAGAIVLLENFTGADPLNTDADVWDSMEAMALETGITIDDAEYTDYQGGKPSVVKVGSGDPIPSWAQGVHATGSREHETLIMQVVGIHDVTVRNDAISVTGPSTEPCPASQEGCALLPVTVPVTFTTCDGQNKAEITEDPWTKGVLYVFPLCGNPSGDSGGSYGWIDWDGGGGGAPDVWDQVCDPHPPTIHLPGWYEVVSTGNVNAAKLEQCFNDNWAGKIILIPLFDDKCKNKPPPGDPCSDPGSPKWYHFPAYAVIQFEWAYINGSNAICNAANGATSCLVGTFVDGVVGGTVGSIDDLDDTTPSHAFTVQLIH